MNTKIFIPGSILKHTVPNVSHEKNSETLKHIKLSLQNDVFMQAAGQDLNSTIIWSKFCETMSYVKTDSPLLFLIK
jgi:hypothetical protein